MKKGESPYRGTDFREWLAPRIKIASAGYKSKCWLWRLTLCRKGYARWRVPQQFGKGTSTVALHRLSYEQLVGPIPDGLVIDHLCRNRGCLNPEHLEPTTGAENTRRGINQFAARDCCGRGHPYTPDTSYADKRGYRHCRICQRANVTAHRTKVREALDHRCTACSALLNETNVSGFCARCINARLAISPTENNVLCGKFARLRAVG